MSSIFGPQPGSSPGATFRSIVGIVDKIPGERTESTIETPPACEGIAYLLSYGDHIETESERAVAVDAPPAVVRVKLLPGRLMDVKDFKSVERSKASGYSSVAVPLANTLFVNGRRSTLIETLWTKSDSRVLTRGASKQLKALNISLHHALRKLRRHIPLQRLTPDRRVTSAMGNVLRAVEVEGMDVPASKELEEVIAGRTLPAHADGSRPQVFAAIVPKNRIQLSDRPLPWNLLAGMGFYRVTGGGGGWGQKQGLLSFDPTRAYDTVNDDTLPPGLSDTAAENIPDFLGPRKSLVQVGDHVAFWGEKGGLLPREKPSGMLRHLAWGAGGLEQNLILGILPPPGKGEQGLTDGHENALVVRMEGSFGLLSEKGLAFEFDGVLDASAADGADASGEAVKPSEGSAEQSGQRFCHQTIVEVPGSWVGSSCWNLSHETAQRLWEKKHFRQLELEKQQEPENYEALMQNRRGRGRAADKSLHQPAKHENLRLPRNVRKERRPDVGGREIVFDIDVPQPDNPESTEKKDTKGGFFSLAMPRTANPGSLVVNSAEAELDDMAKQGPRRTTNQHKGSISYVAANPGMVGSDQAVRIRKILDHGGDGADRIRKWENRPSFRKV